MVSRDYAVLIITDCSRERWLDKEHIEMLGSDSWVQIVSGHDDPNTYELIARSPPPLEHSIRLSLRRRGHRYANLGHWAGWVALFAENPSVAEIVCRRKWVPVPVAVSDKSYRHGCVQNLLPLIA